MQASIQTKLLALCILLVLLATVSISVAYYTLTRQDKRRESQQRIQIAFEIIANLEQKRATEEIERSMEEVIEQFSDISEQTETLQQNSDQIVSAMHTIESTTGQILQNATAISAKTVKNLVQQLDVLQKIVNRFKVS